MEERFGLSFLSHSLGDLNADGQLDLAVLQNGGASFYYGFYSENNHFGFTSVLLLGMMRMNSFPFLESAD